MGLVGERTKRRIVALLESDFNVLEGYAKAKGLAITKAIVKAVEEARKLEDVKRAFYDSRVDVALWYCEKLAFSVQALKDSKSDEQLQRLKRLLKQVAWRYKVDVSLLEEVASAFVKGDADVVIINEVLKEVLKSVLRKVMLGE